MLGRRGVEHAAFTTPELIGLAGLEDVDVLLDGPPPAGDGVRARLLADLARPYADAAGRGSCCASTRRWPRCSPGAVRLASGECVEADLVVSAIGHRWTPVEHERGRVRPGEYVVGWAKRGPTGFIGTNKADAEETVATRCWTTSTAAPRARSGGCPHILTAWRARRTGGSCGGTATTPRAARTSSTRPSASWPTASPAPRCTSSRSRTAPG